MCLTGVSSQLSSTTCVDVQYLLAANDEQVLGPVFQNENDL